MEYKYILLTLFQCVIFYYHLLNYHKLSDASIPLDYNMVILQEQVIEVCDNYRENGEIKYLWLNSVDLAIERVGKRVATGGHSIPEDTIRRRYRTGIQNLSKFYMPICDY